jgi:hypothetical protein
MRRQRINHTATFEERLAEEARRFKEAAEEQPPGSTARLRPRQLPDVVPVQRSHDADPSKHRWPAAVESSVPAAVARGTLRELRILRWLGGISCPVAWKIFRCCGS